MGTNGHYEIHGDWDNDMFLRPPTHPAIVHVRHHSRQVALAASHRCYDLTTSLTKNRRPGHVWFNWRRVILPLKSLSTNSNNCTCCEITQREIGRVPIPDT
jgi:hypothetical protein